MDNIVTGFLRVQQEQAAALAEASDIFSLTPVAGDPPWRYVLEFQCAGLIRVGGQIQEADHFAVGLTFAPEHLRQPPIIPGLLTWLKPETIWHPNVRFPFVCIGDVAAGTGITDIIHRVYEVITFQKLTPVEWDALNQDACVWAREHMDRFPLDGRPLKRPTLVAHPTSKMEICP